jgi:hypothetical protein
VHVIGSSPTPRELKEHSQDLVLKAQRVLTQSVVLNAKLRAITMAAYKLQQRIEHRKNDWRIVGALML